jgi:hypothetical protein
MRHYGIGMVAMIYRGKKSDIADAFHFVFCVSVMPSAQTSVSQCLLGRQNDTVLRINSESHL